MPTEHPRGTASAGTRNALARLAAVVRALGPSGTLLVLVLAAAPVLWLTLRNAAVAIDPDHALLAPSLGHPLGTDQLGRDVLVRVAAAAPVDIAIGMGAVLGGAVIGIVVGVVAGWCGGWVDEVISRIMDIVAAFPFIVLAIAILAALGPGLESLIVSFIAVGWVGYGRIARNESKALRQREFVLAARGLGRTTPWILRRHVIPNVLPVATVFALSDFILAILASAAVGFFGLGVQQPTPEWGAMVADGRSHMSQAWWLALSPGVSIGFLALVGGAFADRIADRMRGMR
ncbi:ABC transporter permease [Streptomyces sp. NPDC004752]